MPNNNSVSMQDIEKYEEEQNFKLPEDYKQFMLKRGKSVGIPLEYGIISSLDINGGLDYFTKLYKEGDEWYESNAVIDYKEWYKDSLELNHPEDYKSFLEAIGGDVGKKRIIIAQVGGKPFLTLSESGEVEYWDIDASAGCEFEQVANSFTEFLNSLQPEAK